jgi:hypothetical protein
MGTTPRTPFVAWGLYRERIGRTVAMEWREMGVVFTHDDGSGGIGHFKSLPCGWNHRIAFRRPEDGPPPLPVARGTPQQPQQPQPTGEPEEPEDEQSLLFGDPE